MGGNVYENLSELSDIEIYDNVERILGVDNIKLVGRLGGNDIDIVTTLSYEVVSSCFHYCDQEFHKGLNVLSINFERVQLDVIFVDDLDWGGVMYGGTDIVKLKYRNVLLAGCVTMMSSQEWKLGLDIVYSEGYFLNLSKGLCKREINWKGGKKDEVCISLVTNNMERLLRYVFNNKSLTVDDFNYSRLVELSISKWGNIGLDEIIVRGKTRLGSVNKSDVIPKEFL